VTNLPAPEDSAASTAAPTHTYTSSTGGNNVALSVTGDFLRIDISGEALDSGIVGLFRDALAEGTMRPNMMTLVDLSNFKGGIDWSAIHAIAGLAPWGSGPGPMPRVAFVTRSVWFAAMLKIASILFPKSEHREFSSAANAIRWLQSGTQR
jgi:hypothetical protein